MSTSDDRATGCDIEIIERCAFVRHSVNASTNTCEHQEVKPQ